MTLAAHELVSLGDYNRLQTQVSNILGTGSSSFGYGQPVLSTPRTQNDIVSQQDWDNLRFDIVNVNIHQTGSAFMAVVSADNTGNLDKLYFNSADVGFLQIGMAVFGTGVNHPIDGVKYITAINTLNGVTTITLNTINIFAVAAGTIINFGPGTYKDFEEGELISIATISSYSTAITAASEVSARFSVGVGQYTTSNIGSVIDTYDNDPWSNELTFEVPATFRNADEARFFFNSGGYVIFSLSRSGGNATLLNTAWSTLLSQAGSITFGAQLPSSGFDNLDGRNFYSLTHQYQTCYELSGSGDFSTIKLVVEAKSNVANNTTGIANALSFKIRLINNNVGPVDGSIQINVSERKPFGKLLPSGNFQVNSPSYILGTISRL